MRAAAAFALALAACAPMTAEAPGLEGPVWVLTSLGGEPVEARAFLRFDPAVQGGPRVSGEAPCNLFNGAWSGAAEGGALSLGPLIATRRFCPEMSVEDAFLRALGAAAEATREGDTLTITSPDSAALVFAATEAEPPRP